MLRALAKAEGDETQPVIIRYQPSRSGRPGLEKTWQVAIPFGSLPLMPAIRPGIGCLKRIAYYFTLIPRLGGAAH